MPKCVKIFAVIGANVGFAPDGLQRYIAIKKKGLRLERRKPL
jgi:hypothetical protein